MIIDQQVKDFRAALMKFGISEGVDSLCSDFKDMLQYRKPPSTYWGFLDSGAFKECYEVPVSDKIVIKFAVNSDDIMKSEEDLLSLAREKGIDHFFPKTVYLPLDTPIPSGVYKDSGIEGDSDYVLIQEKVKPVYDNENIWSNYAPNRLFDHNGEFLPLHILRSCYIESLTWCTLAVRYYGAKHFKELCRFIMQEEVEDIGFNNVGFLSSSNRPVIFDWICPGNVCHC